MTIGVKTPIRQLKDRKLKYLYIIVLRYQQKYGYIFEINIGKKQ